MDKPPAVIRNARTCRRNLTEARMLLWQHLRNRQLAGAKFRRAAPVGRRVVDFLCKEVRLVVEVTGPALAPKLLEEADSALRAQGYGVVRVPRARVTAAPVDVLNEIAQVLAARRGEHPGRRPG